MHLLGDTLRIQATEGHASRVERDRGYGPRPSTDGTIVFSTTNLAAPPVRVRLIEGEQPARASASAPPQPSPQRPTPPVDALGPRPPTIAPAAAPPALPDACAGSGRCPSPSVGSRQRSYWPYCCSAFPTPPGPSNSALWSASGGRRRSDCGGWVLSHGCCAPDPLARSPCHFPSHPVPASRAPGSFSPDRESATTKRSSQPPFRKGVACLLSSARRSSRPPFS